MKYIINVSKFRLRCPVLRRYFLYVPTSELLLKVQSFCCHREGNWKVSVVIENYMASTVIENYNASVVIENYKASGVKEMKTARLLLSQKKTTRLPLS